MKTMNSSGKGSSRKNWFAVGLVAMVVIAAPMASAQAPTAKDYQRPDGTKVFGERTLKDGTVTKRRIEFPDGQKNFDVTVLPDGTKKIVREEFPNGQKSFDVTQLPDGTKKMVRIELPKGEKDFDVTILPDGTQKFGRVEFPDGRKVFDMTQFPNGTQTIGRSELPDGGKHFDATKPSDIQTVTTVDAVWAAPGFRFAKVHHPNGGGSQYLVCETQREDCQPLRVGKTYPAAMIDNDTSKAYPYHKKIEQVSEDQTCTSVMFRTLVIITDEVGDKIREVTQAFGDTTVPLYYALLAKPDASDGERCHPNRK